MKMIEFEGKTIDEAIEKACRELGAPREKLNVEIVAEGTSGFFGLGSKPAKIKARLMNINIAEEHAAEPVDFSARATAQVTMGPIAYPYPGRRGSRRRRPGCKGRQTAP